ncbi:BamA/TamA family outer membrane protein [Sediminibacterium ginsengisoli]|uniref:Surface antigen n=1 Tax=Sediminibacterium ginsengisoli TaxID=413434 RepID=A0A1T4NY65_9BACT|nr:BamA/TamA family outer membrane protein [Sediminibacterium ginsengisoli]SJZ84320.1 Surface antigen [Sediminibacterium ginsengisoli]
MKRFVLLLCFAASWSVVSAQQDSVASKQKWKWLGKLHPDSLVNRSLTLLPTPMLSSSPESGLRMGLILQYFLNTEGNKGSNKTRDSYSYLQATYSTMGQFEIENHTQLYTPGEKFFIRNQMSYTINKERVWGFGNSTVPKDDFQRVKYTWLNLQSSVTRQLSNKFFVGLNFNVSKIYDVSIQIKDSNLLSSQPGSSGSFVLGLGPTVLWDRRDHALNPRKGWYTELAITRYLPTLGSEFSYTEFLADLRKYYPLRDSSVLAFQGYSVFTSGQVPWREQSRMGNGTIMRGYFSGRFRDNQYAAVQAEYRKPVHKWVVLALFTSIGQVQDKFSDFAWNNTRLAGGAGLRILVNKKKRIYGRIDFAVSSDRTNGLYLKVGDAF